MFGFVTKSVFYWINNFMKFHKLKFIELYFYEQSRMYSKVTNC